MVIIVILLQENENYADKIKLHLQIFILIFAKKCANLLILFVRAKALLKTPLYRAVF